MTNFWYSPFHLYSPPHVRNFSSSATFAIKMSHFVMLRSQFCICSQFRIVTIYIFFESRRSFAICAKSRRIFLVAQNCDTSFLGGAVCKVTRVPRLGLFKFMLKEQNMYLQFAFFELNTFQ